MDSTTPAFSIEYAKGNLFTAPAGAALAHCVSQDFYMNAGIAKQFKILYGNVDTLQMQNCAIGEVASLTNVDSSHNLYYLVTKELYHHKPTYEALSACLLQLAVLCKSANIKHLCMPKIGCGLDQLEWEYVSRLIVDHFKDLNIRVTIYVL